MINLEILYLVENQLNSSIPPKIGQLKSLNDLSLYANNLRGSIPASLGNLSYLFFLYLNDNVLCSKDLGFYVFRTLICIVGKP